MRAVFRYQVTLDGPVTVGLTLTANPVAFGALGRSAGIEFWAEHDDTLPAVPRTFTVVGTGHPVPDGAAYVGSAPRTREGLVWHLFELPAVAGTVVADLGELGRGR
jgi:hypothetical protein